MSDILPKYSFFPFIRQGISAQITEEENLAGSSTIKERAEIELKVKIKGDGVLKTSPSVNVKLIGPGDIIGLSQNAIVKTEPLNWITNFEPNYFPYIDFYDEDFPWRYTPAKATADHKLRPWLFLVVLKENEFVRNPVSLDGLLPSILVAGAETADSTNGPFPNAAETWAWAHVQLTGDVDPNNTKDINDAVSRLNSLVTQNPDLAISRIICPRKLEENTSYYAFLIPSFETGRLAGLGIDPNLIKNIPAQEASWGGGANSHTQEPNKYPVYYEWYFKTGSTGDLEYLVRQLKPRQLDSRVGRRPMDIQDPGYLLSYQGGTDPTKGTLALEGALRIPGNEGELYPWTDQDLLDFGAQMQDLVNLGEDMTADNLGTVNWYGNKNIGAAAIQDDPIVAPPLYGRWHALKNKVDSTDPAWIHELNIDPRNRVVAGIGTAVVQKYQDQFMDMAWEQLGEVLEANKKLRWAQLAKETSIALYQKHIKPQPEEQFIPLTAKMHKRIKSGTETIFQTTAQSALPLAAESRSFRKIRRLNGPLMKRIDPTKSTAQADNMFNNIANHNFKTAKEKAPGNITEQTTHETVDLDDAVGKSQTLDTNNYNFEFTSPGSTAPVHNGIDTTNAVAFKGAVQIFQDYFKSANWASAATKPALDVNNIATEVKQAIEPSLTITKRVYKQLQFSETITPPAPDKIVPILAAPHFVQPMFEAIRDLSLDLLIPNLNLIPQNSMALLETNPKFIESFMVGLNHEMGRELLWREYPTEQRCTCFRHFWDTIDYVNQNGLDQKDLENRRADIDFIHSWPSTSLLGSHNAREVGNGSQEAKLVLVIRGDLLKKYPNAVIYAVKGKWQLDSQQDPDTSLPRELDFGTEKYPVFGGKVEPDIAFLGFDLYATDAIGDISTEDPGWFFVVKERPGEPRFGLDVSTGNSTTPASWNDLSWDHMPANINYINITDTVTPSDNAIPSGTTNAIPWGENSVNMAMIHYQNPVMIAIHAHEMLADIV